MPTAPDRFTLVDQAALSDNELVRRILENGDRQAANLLVQKYQRLVFSIAYRIVANATEADDLVQMIFVRVFGGLKTFVPGTEFKSWMYAIAVNTSLNARKQAKRRQGMIEKAAVRAREADEADPGADLENEEARNRIEAAIDRLPEEQRVVLHLRLKDNLTHEQIAKLVGVPSATVTSRLFLARKKLELLLRDPSSREQETT